VGTESVVFNVESSVPLEVIAFAGTWWFTN